MNGDLNFSELWRDLWQDSERILAAPELQLCDAPDADVFESAVTVEVAEEVGEPVAA